MRRVLQIGLFCCWTGFVSLAHYEMAAKTHAWLGARWPGWRQAAQAEYQTPIHHHTGIRLVDRLIHEGEETLAFYGLLGGRAPRAPLALAQLQIPQ